MQLLVASKTSRMLKSATDNFGLAWKMWQPAFEGKFTWLFLLVAIHSCVQNLNVVMCACTSCEQHHKNLYGLQWFLHLWSYFVQACCTLPLFLFPLKGVGLALPTRPWIPRWIIIQNCATGMWCPLLTFCDTWMSLLSVQNCNTEYIQ